MKCFCWNKRFRWFYEYESLGHVRSLVFQCFLIFNYNPFQIVVLGIVTRNTWIIQHNFDQDMFQKPHTTVCLTVTFDCQGVLASYTIYSQPNVLIYSLHKLKNAIFTTFQDYKLLYDAIFWQISWIRKFKDLMIYKK